MAKLVDQGEHDVLLVYLAAKATLYLGLFTDVVEPAETATLSSGLTELPVANGYARIALAFADWNIVADLATHLQQTFTASVGDWGNVYGYFICDVASGTVGNLLFVESFSDGPYYVLNGEPVKVTPAILAS